MFVTICMKTLYVLKDTMIFTNKTAFTQASMENTVVHTIVHYKIFLGSIKKKHFSKRHKF